MIQLRLIIETNYVKYKKLITGDLVCCEPSEEGPKSETDEEMALGLRALLDIVQQGPFQRLRVV